MQESWTKLEVYHRKIYHELSFPAPRRGRLRPFKDRHPLISQSAQGYAPELTFTGRILRIRYRRDSARK